MGDMTTLLDWIDFESQDPIKTDLEKHQVITVSRAYCAKQGPHSN